MILPKPAVILPVTTIFRAVRLMSLVLLAESGAETVMLFEVVVRLRSLPEMNDVALATLMVPDVALVKLTVRSSTKLPGETLKPNDEPELATLFVIWMELREVRLL